MGIGGWARTEAARLLGRRYPDFVYARDPARLEGGYLPVFTFHSLEPADFEAKLRFLDENGYSTLTLDRALAHVRGERPAPSRSVVLTIDDGRLSTWTVGLPLLRRYRMTATAFVIPGYLEEGPARPTMDDGDPTGGTGGPLGEPRDRRTLLRWSEVLELHRSDAIAVESHTMLHRRVVVSRRLVGFLQPRMATAPYDLPLPRDRREGWTREELQERLGAPIYEHDAVLGTPRALEPPGQAAERCLERVRREGGARFFEQWGWRRRLRRIADAGPGEAFRPYDTERLQRTGLVAAREALEERLDGKRVRHLCLPSGRGSPRAVRLAREAGYRTALWGLLAGRPTNRPGTDPMQVERLKHDYIHRLPGEGRRSLVGLVTRKSLRRLRGETGY